jgi:hypothetical protein
MDSYREYPSDFDLESATETPPPTDVALAIGTDERRMHVRAYNHWVSLLDGRDFPSIEDLDAADLNDFASHGVLLDFTSGGGDPAVAYIGAEIKSECGLRDDTRTIADVPSRSLLSRLTDHYLQIIANRAPIGFEAEFANQRDETIGYRGILLPFSSDGDTIDFIYGVINWKTVPASAHSASPAEAAPRPLTEPAPLTPFDDRADGPAVDHAGPDLDAETEQLACIELDDDAGLADRLWAARETAESVKSVEGRSRVALYRALSLAYDFAVAAQDNPRDYAELLEESGVKAQARAPMTPVVKLVFGIDYDKARLTEFAAALSYAQRRQIGLGGFQRLIETQPGGLKALVAAERLARRPDRRPDDRGERARAKLRAAQAFPLGEMSESGEFALVVTRRGADGRHQPIAVIDDQALLERALRRAA